MDWWIILVIVLAGLVVLGVATVVGRRTQERRVAGKRAEATELRDEAQARAERADERARLAAEQAEQSRQERADAEARARRADEVDPDVET